MQVDQEDQKHQAEDKEERKAETEEMEVKSVAPISSSLESSEEGISSAAGVVIHSFVSPFQTSEDGKQEKTDNSRQEKSGDGKQEKKNDQPPQAKKPKVKTKTTELPVQNNLHWQLPTDVLNMFVENEVMV